MRQVREHSQPLGDDVVALSALYVRNEANTARVVIERRMVEPSVLLSLRMLVFDVLFLTELADRLRFRVSEAGFFCETGPCSDGWPAVPERTKQQRKPWFGSEFAIDDVVVRVDLMGACCIGRNPEARAVLIMGVSGGGKSTIESCVAQRLGWSVLDAGVSQGRSPSHRLQARTDHFLNSVLLDSQFDALEEPEGSFAVDVAQEPSAIVDTIVEEIQSGLNRL